MVTQRDISCYMVSRGPSSLRVEPVSSLPSNASIGNPQPLGVGTFEFEPLGDSGSKAFSVRIPGRPEPPPIRWIDGALRRDSELSRLLPFDGREEMNNCEPFYWGNENLSMRNTVTLNPLQHQQGTAFAYDLSELSRTGNEQQRAHTVKGAWEGRQQGENDEFAPSPSRGVRRISDESMLKSERKLRSLQKLRHLSLEKSVEATDPDCETRSQ